MLSMGGGRRMLVVCVGALLVLAGVVPVSAGPAAASRTPIQVYVTASPSAVHAGEQVNFHITLRSANDGLQLTRWAFGDGSSAHTPTLMVSCPAQPAGTTVPVARTAQSPETTGMTLSAIYRTAGTRMFSVTASHAGGCSPLNDRGTGSGSVQVDVLGPDAASNGPGSPEPGTGVHGSRTGAAALTYLTADDSDGLVRTVSLTIDGGPPQRFATGRHCADPGTYWRPSTWMKLVHRTLPRGAHTITVVAVSTGCDGKDAQTTRVVRRLVVDAKGCFSDRHDLSYSPPLRAGNPQQAQSPTPDGVTYATVPDRPGPYVCG